MPGLKVASACWEGGDWADVPIIAPVRERGTRTRGPREGWPGARPGRCCTTIRLKEGEPLCPADPSISDSCCWLRWPSPAWPQRPIRASWAGGPSMKPPVPWPATPASRGTTGPCMAMRSGSPARPRARCAWTAWTTMWRSPRSARSSAHWMTAPWPSGWTGPEGAPGSGSMTSAQEASPTTRTSTCVRARARPTRCAWPWWPETGPGMSSTPGGPRWRAGGTT